MRLMILLISLTVILSGCVTTGSTRIVTRATRFETQRQALKADYDAGKVSSEGYYQALSQIDKNEIEDKRAESQSLYEQQQVWLQQQQVGIHRQQAETERRQSRQVNVFSSGGNTKTITNRSGKVVGYVQEN